MRTRLLVSCAVVGVGLIACSSSDDGGGVVGTGGSHHGTTDSGAYGTGGSSGTGYAGGTGGGGGTNYGGGAGSGGSYGSADAGPEPGNDAGADAQTDAGDAGACDGLDAEMAVSFFLSSDDSNSMASPAIARRLLGAGSKVPPQIVRTYEFLNYYNVGFPAAAPGTLAIVPELRAATEPGTFELGIGVVAPAAQNPRRPMVVTFVLDTSGSMDGTPMGLEKESVKAIASELSAGDIASAVVWSTSNAVLLDSHVVTGPNDPVLLSLADGLSAGGGTDLNGGLTAGYALAKKNFNPSRLNRVVLISDGQANVGVTDETIIGEGALLEDGEGIYLVGVGVGNGVNDTLMNAVTDAGRGAYVYLDTASEAKKMLSTRFDEVMEVAARGVQVELKLPWYMAISKFYGEEYSTNPEEIEPQHLAPNDAMVFDQLLKPCSESVFSASDPIEIIARWQVPVTHQAQEVSLSSTLGQLADETPVFLPKAAAIVAYAEALKAPGASGSELTKARALAVAANPGGSDPELSEIAALLDKALMLY